MTEIRELTIDELHTVSGGATARASDTTAIRIGVAATPPAGSTGGGSGGGKSS